MDHDVVDAAALRLSSAYPFGAIPTGMTKANTNTNKHLQHLHNDSVV